MYKKRKESFGDTILMRKTWTEKKEENNSYVLENHFDFLISDGNENHPLVSVCYIKKL